MINWKELNKKAVLLLINDKVKFVMDSKNFGTQYEVGDEDFYTVVLDTEGRFKCTCKSCIYVPEFMCSHKISVILKTQRDIFK